MTEWWTYGLADFLMFSGRTWYRMLELHNRAWWPAQPFLMVAGTGLVWALRSGARTLLAPGMALLGLLHLFVAWAFHWLLYSEINWGARYFAIGFVLQGLALLALGLWRRDLHLAQGTAANWLGAGLLVVGVLLYPVLVLMWGRPLTQSEWFGLTPDPTVLATLGMLLCLDGFPPGAMARAARRLMFLVPLLWCAVSGATLWSLDAPDWFMLPAAGVLALVLAWRHPLAKPFAHVPPER